MQSKQSNGAKHSINSIGFILRIPKRSQKNQWDLERAQKLAGLLREYYVQFKPVEYEEIIKKMTANGYEITEASVRAFVDELRQAAKAGKTLKQYMQEGRPFRAGAKVLAPEKPSKK